MSFLRHIRRMISCQNLQKDFLTYKKQPGFLGTLKSFYKRESIRNSAVSDFHLEIKKGEFVGLLGPNGAGKTTLMKMLTGIVVPTSGVAEVLGHQPAARSLDFRRKIALVMGQKSQLWWDIPAMDSFLLLQKYYEIPERGFRERLEQLSLLLDVKKVMEIQVRRLSLGERMKLELMASLLHQPEVIFLDEPTIGLDLVAQKNIRSFLKEYHQEHRPTVILTSHYMADVEALCERLVLIFDGKKVFDGDIQVFEKILGKEKFVSFVFNEPIQQRSHFQDYHPQWNENHTQVDLRIPEQRLRETSIEILQKFPVSDFLSEKMPIERVMKTIMENPEILHQRASRA